MGASVAPDRREEHAEPLNHGIHGPISWVVGPANPRLPGLLKSAGAREEIRSLVEELDRYAREPSTVKSLSRIVQAWGNR